MCLELLEESWNLRATLEYLGAFLEEWTNVEHIGGVLLYWKLIWYKSIHFWMRKHRSYSFWVDIQHLWMDWSRLSDNKYLRFARLRILNDINSIRSVNVLRLIISTFFKCFDVLRCAFLKIFGWYYIYSKC